MASFTLNLPVTERDALFKLAERECRTPQQQAQLILRRELERVGLLESIHKGYENKDVHIDPQA